MPKKAEFRVIYASSEDEKCKSKELDHHGPTVKGWISEKFCRCPQDLVLRLENPIILTQVQILAHQYLIPKKIELWIGPEDEKSDLKFEDLNFEYVGYITLSDNEKSNFKSRELKSISVPNTKSTSFVKLSLQEYHENRHNNFGQVSLVAVQLLGEKSKSIVTNLSPYEDLSFEMYVDKEIAGIIRKLESKKNEAVKRERFSYAGKLKTAMNGLREGGEKLGRYEVSKAQAVANEDYARANRKKEQIEQLKSQLYQSYNLKILMEDEGPDPRNDIREKDDTCLEDSDLPDIVEQAASSVLPSHYQSPLSPLRYTSPTGHQNQHCEIMYIVGDQKSGSRTPVRSGSFRKNKRPTSSYEQYDERVIPPTHHRLHEERPAGQLPKMNEREKKQASLPISVFGIQLVEKFYSRQYPDKEEAVKTLENVLKNGGVEGNNKVARAAVFLLHRALRDKVFSIYSQAASAVEFFFNSFIANSRVSTSEIARSVEKLLPELLTKSGDVTPRIHNTAVHTILSMAHAPELRKLNLIPVHMTRPLTSSLHPRLALSRLEIVEQLICSLGISAEKNSGMTGRTLAEFGASGLHHPAEAVRKVAERVLVLVYRVNPRMVRKQLPPDDDITRRNLLYRHLMREFDKIDLELKASEDKEPQKNGHQRSLSATERELTNDSGARGASDRSEHTARSEQRRLARSGSVSEARRPQSAYFEPVPVKENFGLKTSASSYNAGQIERTSSPQHPDKQCIFCYRVSEKFTEEGLNIHYWKYCPMLTRCNDCGEVVEIPCLEAHISAKCSNSGQRQESSEVRCLFCKNILENSEKGWQNHLVTGPICSGHPRAAYIKKDLGDEE